LFILLFNFPLVVRDAAICTRQIGQRVEVRYVDKNNQLGIPNGNIPGLAYPSGIAQFNIPGYYGTGDPGWTNAKQGG